MRAEDGGLADISSRTLETEAVDVSLVESINILSVGGLFWVARRRTPRLVDLFGTDHKVFVEKL